MAYKVRFVNFPEHYQRMWDEINEAVQGCLRRGDFIARQALDDFEEGLAKFVGTKYSVGLNSGTDALVLSCALAGIKPKDEVITVSHTFVATITSVVMNGGTPVLVDTGADMEMDVAKAEKAITKKTKAIIPVHLNGRMVDMKAVHEIADAHGLTVIEDSAQALGAKFGNYRSGASGFTGCFSFYPAKILGCAGDGGALTTNDEELVRKARLLRDHGFKRDTNDLVMYGYNSRLDNIQAAILNVKLKYLPDWLETRREIARKYQDGLKGIDGLVLPPAPTESGPYYDVFQNYVIRSDRRDELNAFLRNEGIETLISWPKPNHSHPNLHLDHFKLPETEKLCRTVVSLPMFPELKNEEIQYVIDAVNRFYGR